MIHYLIPAAHYFTVVGRSVLNEVSGNGDIGVILVVWEFLLIFVK